MDIAKEYVKRIVKATLYIEKNIEEELSIDGIAKQAHYSPFHFHRIFRVVVGETVHKYIKRLRIEKAAGKLRYTNLPITEIALDTNYDTPSAFTKAFKEYMGSSPKNYRAFYSILNATAEKIKELPMIHPDQIENNMPDLNLLFIRKSGSYDTSPKEAWQAMTDFIHEEKLNSTTLRYFGISYDDPKVTQEEKLRYDAAILAPCIKTEKLNHQTLKGGKYAIFTHKGPYGELEEVFNRIFLKWLPNSREILDEARPVFCEYFNRHFITKDPEKLTTKLFIPLI